tara:strand:- start:6477 stop:6842 length:366 start_codon:yes stop_codon:yes gene_type:complete
MHLVRGMTTTSTKKRKTKGTTAADRKAQAEHDKWLRKMGVHPEQLAKREKVAVNSIPDYKKDSRGIPTSDRICGNGIKKQGNTYSGERQLLGVATMHKSNMVPVFADKKEDAVDIAQMRRN